MTDEKFRAFANDCCAALEEVARKHDASTLDAVEFSAALLLTQTGDCYPCALNVLNCVAQRAAISLVEHVVKTTEQPKEPTHE